MFRVTTLSAAVLFRRGHQFRYELLKNNLFLFSPKRKFSVKKVQLSKFTDVLNPSRNINEDWIHSALPMRYLYVNTSQQRWEDIPDGFIFDTGYIDSHAESPYNPKVPLVLAIHDMYGGHENLLPLLAPLVLKNYRVIALNLPSSNHTNGVGIGHDDAFLYTTDEYAEFIGDFLGELNIPKVDVMLGYGTGCYPILRICTKTDLCHSAALLCPGGHLIYKGIEPYRFYETLTGLWEIPFLRPYLRIILFFLKYLKGLQKYTTDEIVMSLKTIKGIDFMNIGSYLFSLKAKEIPIGVLYCKNDPQIETHICEQFCELLGLKENQMTFYDNNGQIIKQASLSGKFEGIVLEEKPDNVCRDFRLPIIRMIEKFISSVHQPQ